MTVLVCFQDKDQVRCLCTWLLASCKLSTYHELRHVHHDAEQKHWNADHLTNIVMTLVKDDSVKTVLQGFKIFLPVSPSKRDTEHERFFFSLVEIFCSSQYSSRNVRSYHSCSSWSL